MIRYGLAAALLPLLLAACGDEPASTATAPVVHAWAKVAPEQIAEAEKHGVPVAFENDLGMRFVLIPAGTFLMGSPEDEAGREDEETQHEVTISLPFYVQITEVRNADYRRFRPNHSSGKTLWHDLDDADQPVVLLSWPDSAAYAAWLSRLDEQRDYRLATEAEWEYACRAGTTSMYWWGTSEGSRFANAYDSETEKLHSATECWPRDDGYRVTAPVGTFPPSPWGLHDMLGNVEEWFTDRVRNDEASIHAMDPSGPLYLHACRGGSWMSSPQHVRSAARYFTYGSGRTHGFRLVSPLPE